MKKKKLNELKFVNEVIKVTNTNYCRNKYLVKRKELLNRKEKNKNDS